MSKYVFTEKMPLFEGLQLEKSLDTGYGVLYWCPCITETGEALQFECYEGQIPYLLERGLISEVKEPTWTDDDMIEFGEHIQKEMTKGYLIPQIYLLDFKKEKGIC